MEKSKRKIIILAAIAILVIIILLWLMLRGSDVWQPQNSTPLANDNTSFIPPSKNLAYDPNVVPVFTETEFNVINLAKDFAARFGSWSTDNQGKNLEELLPLSTSNMKNYLAGIELNYDTENFTGISTKSLSAKIKTMDEESAVIIVSTQRIETNSQLEDKVYYQDIEIQASKIGDKWLVDAANWQE
ncbi:hypothetical protein C4566_01805 [Candidatus Parcubacteria bacterium]|nr:MAG: hypothetical protein C4566_01805 [Candidatus Parcubacteria bacterium]